MAAMNKAQTKIEFGDLPKDYAGLCQILPPRLIHDKADFKNVTEIGGHLFSKKGEKLPDCRETISPTYSFSR